MLKKINWIDDFGILVIRLMLGAVFLFHGGQKLFAFFDGIGLAGFAQQLESLNLPYPAYGAVLAGSAEFLGGLALISGFGMRTMALPLIVTMGVASWFVHSHTFSIQQDGIEYPLTLGVILFGLACTGPGKFSLRRLWPERSAYQVATDGPVVRERVLRRTSTATVPPQPTLQKQIQTPRATQRSTHATETMNVARTA